MQSNYIIILLYKIICEGRFAALGNIEVLIINEFIPSCIISLIIRWIILKQRITLLNTKYTHYTMSSCIEIN